MNKITAAATLFNALSPREAEVFMMIVTGRDAREIAAALGIAISTVGVYKARIMEKTKLGNAVRMAHYAIAIGLIKPQTE